MMMYRLSTMLVVGAIAATTLCAQTESDPSKSSVSSTSDADHDQLRALRASLTKALSDGDIEAQLEFASDDIVTTWQNSQVARGKEGLRKFLAKMNGTGERVFQGYKVPPTPDDLSILYGGDTAIAFGSSVPHYKYLGMEFDLANRWTATLVKDNGNWKIAAYHVSSNILDNPVLDVAERSSFWAGGGGLLIGIVVGTVGANLIRRKRS